MPIWATFTVFFIMSSVGLPGLNGFIGEFLSIVGAFVSGTTMDGQVTPGTLGPWFAIVAGFGMILAAIYLLYLAGRVIFGPLKLPETHHDDEAHATPKLPRDLNMREIAVLTPIAIACVVLGVQPGLMLDPIQQPIERIVDTIHEANIQHAQLMMIGESDMVMMDEDSQDQTELANKTMTGGAH